MIILHSVSVETVYSRGELRLVADCNGAYRWKCNVVISKSKSTVAYTYRHTIIHIYTHRDTHTHTHSERASQRVGVKQDLGECPHPHGEEGVQPLKTHTHTHTTHTHTHTHTYIYIYIYIYIYKYIYNDKDLFKNHQQRNYDTILLIFINIEK